MYTDRRIKFMNTFVDNLTMSEAIDKIELLIKNKSNSYVVTPNVDHIVRLESDKEFQKIYSNADLVLTDGKPLVWISKIYKTPIVEKVSGSDLFPKLCEMATKKGYRIFFLGAAEGVAEVAANRLRKRFESIKIVGTYSPPFGFEKSPVEIEKICNMVSSVVPDILIVCLGAPKQEKFIYQYKDKLNVPVSIGLGASIDFEAGHIQRSPNWMSNVGLEWFYRFIKEPNRLARRYFVDDLLIIRLFFKYMFKS